MRRVPAVQCVLVVAIAAACGDASPPPPVPSPRSPVTAPAEAPQAPKPRVAPLDAPDAPQDKDLDALIDAYLAAVRVWRGPQRETDRRADAIRALGAPAIERLASQLRGGDPDAASRASGILSLFGAAVVPSMLTIISDTGTQGRGRATPRALALSVLQKTSGAWSDGPLAATVASELMQVVRATDDAAARAEFIETLWCARGAGAPYAAEWGRFALEAESHASGGADLWLRLIRDLGRDGAPAARSVISLLGGNYGECAAEALVDMQSVPGTEMDALRALLHTRDPAAVKSACDVLAGWGSAGNDARPELLQLLGEPAFADFAASAFTAVPDPDGACIAAMLRAAGAGSSCAQERLGDWVRTPSVAIGVEQVLAAADVPALQAGVAAFVEHGGRDGSALVERLLIGRDPAFAESARGPLDATVARVLARRPAAAPLESDVVCGDFAAFVRSRGKIWFSGRDLRRLARDIAEGPPLAAAVREAVAASGAPDSSRSSLLGAAWLSLVLPPDERTRVRAELAAHDDADLRAAVARAIGFDASPEMGTVPVSDGDLRVLVALLRDEAINCRTEAALALAAHGERAAAAIPELDRLASEDAAWGVRMAAVVGLLRLRAAPDMVRPHVGAVLRHDWADEHWVFAREAFAASLSEAPSAAVPLSDVLDALHSDDSDLIRTATDALRPHGSAGAEGVPRLIEVVRAVTKSRPDNGPPRFGKTVIMDSERGPPWTELGPDAGPAAARTLAAIGAAAAPALPALRCLALHADDRAPILAAIRTIEAAQ